MLCELNVFFLESEPSDNARRNMQCHTFNTALTQAPMEKQEVDYCCKKMFFCKYNFRTLSLEDVYESERQTAMVASAVVRSVV